MVKMKNKNEQKSRYREYRKARLLLDALLFAIILTMISLTLIIVSSMPKETNTFYDNYNETEEYLENMMVTILDSTVSKTSYNDSNGVSTDYIGQTVEQLIFIDLSIRASDDGEFNKSDLERGIEGEINNVLTRALGEGRDFVLSVEILEQSRQSKTENVLIISNILEPPEVKKDVPVFERRYQKLSILTDDQDTPEEIFIKLYLM